MSFTQATQKLDDVLIAIYQALVYYEVTKLVENSQRPDERGPSTLPLVVEYDIMKLSQIVKQIVCNEFKLKLCKDTTFLEFIENEQRFQDVIEKLKKLGLVIVVEENGKRILRTAHVDLYSRLIDIRESYGSKPTTLHFKLCRPIYKIHPIRRFKSEDLIARLREATVPNINMSLYEVILQLLKKANRDENWFKKLLKALIDKLLPSGLSKFQLESIVKVLEYLIITELLPEIAPGAEHEIEIPNSLLLVAPTGWGKTEAFLIPAILTCIILDELLGNRFRSRVKVLMIYPRRSLAADQLERIIKYYYRLKPYLEEIGVHLPKIVIRDGDSAVVRSRVRISHAPRAMPGSHFARIDRIKVLVDSAEREVDIIYSDNLTGIRLKLEDKVLADLPITDVRLEHLTEYIPDILIVTLDMLSRLLSCSRFRYVIKQFKLRLIIFDEAHVYTGVAGAHLVYLLRRLRGIVRQIERQDRYICVFSSATINVDSFVKNICDKANLRVKAGLNYNVIDAEKIEDEEAQHEGTSGVRLFLTLVLAPLPDVAGSWLLQLSLLYSILWMWSLNQQAGGQIRLKGVCFIDNLNYLWEVYSKLRRTLGKRAYKILRDHRATQLLEYIRDEFKWCIDVENANGTICVPYAICSNMSVIAQRLSRQFTAVVKYFTADTPLSYRRRIVEEYKRRELPLFLISTNALELGIDIENVSLVFQLSIPFRQEAYIQRLGRAGRHKDTLYIASGVIVLQNNSEDMYRYFAKEGICVELGVEQEERAKPEIKIPEPCETIELQHGLLAIFDYLNIRFDINTDPLLYSYSPVNLLEWCRTIGYYVNTYRKELANYLIQNGICSEYIADKLLNEELPKILRRVEEVLKWFIESSAARGNLSIDKVFEPEVRKEFINEVYALHVTLNTILMSLPNLQARLTMLQCKLSGYKMPQIEDLLNEIGQFIYSFLMQSLMPKLGRVMEVLFRCHNLLNIPSTTVENIHTEIQALRMHVEDLKATIDDCIRMLNRINRRANDVPIEEVRMEVNNVLTEFYDQLEQLSAIIVNISRFIDSLSTRISGFVIILGHRQRRYSLIDVIADICNVTELDVRTLQVPRRNIEEIYGGLLNRAE